MPGKKSAYAWSFVATARAAKTSTRRSDDGARRTIASTSHRRERTLQKRYGQIEVGGLRVVREHGVEAARDRHPDAGAGRPAQEPPDLRDVPEQPERERNGHGPGDDRQRRHRGHADERVDDGVGLERRRVQERRDPDGRTTPARGAADEAADTCSGGPASTSRARPPGSRAARRRRRPSRRRPAGPRRGPRAAGAAPPRAPCRVAFARAPGRGLRASEPTLGADDGTPAGGAIEGRRPAAPIRRARWRSERRRSPRTGGASR